MLARLSETRSILSQFAGRLRWGTWIDTGSSRLIDRRHDTLTISKDLLLTRGGPRNPVMEASREKPRSGGLKDEQLADMDNSTSERGGIPQSTPRKEVINVLVTGFGVRAVPTMRYVDSLYFPAVPRQRGKAVSSQFITLNNTFITIFPSATEEFQQHHCTYQHHKSNCGGRCSCSHRICLRAGFREKVARRIR